MQMSKKKKKKKNLVVGFLVGKAKREIHWPQSSANSEKYTVHHENQTLSWLRALRGMFPRVSV